MAILFTLIFGSFSYLLLKNTDSVLKTTSFSKKFTNNPLLKKFLVFMGWWFLIIVAGVWVIAIITLFE
ncbi:hypothetical protein [Lysinibacillus telephonicus]|uniref:hypothetical protein n=1 Tax=Lysinibacillus telephonicus TaxID=1714840 RepID=UPI000F820ED9|nr:hypothetical protein [Lysinibacillus telephonicus]